jgi:hypothetical protein
MSAKEVMDVLVKVYQSYDDCMFDTNRSFEVIEVEGSVLPNEFIKVDEGIAKIYKKKMITRDTILGSVLDTFYVSVEKN